MLCYQDLDTFVVRDLDSGIVLPIDQATLLRTHAACCPFPSAPGTRCVSAHLIHAHTHLTAVVAQANALVEQRLPRLGGQPEGATEVPKTGIT